MLDNKAEYKTGNLFSVADYILKRKNEIFKLVSRHKTPFYIFDIKALDNSMAAASGCRFSFYFKLMI